MDEVILVDERDQQVGTMEKMEAHRKGLLHRAFSLFIFNSEGQLILQQRALHKYHSGGLWSNTCCSHPQPGEEVAAAAARRLKEEMGLQATMKPAFQFRYQAELENGMVENEFDHVLVGKTNAQPVINPEEAANWKYTDLKMVQKDLSENPQSYSFWFREALPTLIDYLRNHPL